MLDLRSQCEPQPVRYQLNLVLNEAAVERSGPARGIEGNREPIVQVIGCDIVADAHDNVLPVAELKMML